MNTAQKAALGIGVAAIAFMGVFPPWNLIFDYHSGSGGAHSTRPVGYALIYEPPIRYKATALTPAPAQPSAYSDLRALPPGYEVVSIPQQPAPSRPPEPPPEPDPLYTTSIDVTRLLIQWTIVAAVTGGLVLILRNNTGDKSTNGQAGTGRNEPAIACGQIAQSRIPAQDSASSVPAPDGFARLRESMRSGPVIAGKTAGVATQEQPESARVSDYPPIWSQAHTLPAKRKED